jgi:hypothetical protein
VPTPALTARIEALWRDTSLQRPERLGERIEALDRLDALLAGDAPGPLRARATALLERLESANQAIYRDLRQAIRRGDGAATFRSWVRALAPSVHAARTGDGYDALDTLLAGVLAFDEPAGDGGPLPADMVFYQPTPARHILDLIDRAALDTTDVLVDLGSGLGHVPLLASICTGARAVGIERDPAHVACARRCAATLGLQRVEFIVQDARAAGLAAGTLFYLYTPFGGPILRHVLDRLKREAADRAIRVATLGPCTATVAGEPWLYTTDVPRPDRIALFHSHPCDAPGATPMQKRARSRCP